MGLGSQQVCDPSKYRFQWGGYTIMCLGDWHAAVPVFVVIFCFFHLCIYLFIKTRPHCIAYAGLQLVTMLLLQPPKLAGILGMTHA